jgi:energy-coupling factor transporter transmembrane protein EcfT
MKILKDIFLFILCEMNCTKEDFIQAANQESKLESYFTLMYMICKLIITFVSIAGLLFFILMLVLLSIAYYPIIFLPISVIICLPYIAMLFLNYVTKEEKGNKNENKN